MSDDHIYGQIIGKLAPGHRHEDVLPLLRAMALCSHFASHRNNFTSPCSFASNCNHWTILCCVFLSFLGGGLLGLHLVCVLCHYVVVLPSDILQMNST